MFIFGLFIKAVLKKRLIGGFLTVQKGRLVATKNYLVWIYFIIVNDFAACILLCFSLIPKVLNVVSSIIF